MQASTHRGKSETGERESPGRLRLEPMVGPATVAIRAPASSTRAKHACHSFQIIRSGVPVADFEGCGQNLNLNNM